MAEVGPVTLAVSTGAILPGDVRRATELAAAAGADAVEVSALAGPELADALAATAEGAEPLALPVVSLHAPAKALVGTEAERVTALGRSPVPVVAHPDTMDEISQWRRLGERLVVENTDHRKDTGRSGHELARLFDQLGDARMCLDVSHAMSVDGWATVEHLAGRFSDRIDLLHVGCGCGRETGRSLDRQEVAGLYAALGILGRPVPVVLERPVPADDVIDVLGAQLAQIRDLLG